MTQEEKKFEVEVVNFDPYTMWIFFEDGRVLGVPIFWFPKLMRASMEQRKGYTLSGGGTGIHWDELDEDISVEGLLNGQGDAIRKKEFDCVEMKHRIQRELQAEYERRRDEFTSFVDFIHKTAEESGFVGQNKKGIEWRCAMNEIIFIVEDAIEGGFNARALGQSIFTQAETWQELEGNVREAVECHFDEGQAPQIIRLHYSREEVIGL